MLVTLAHKLNLGFSKCRSFLRPKRKLGLVSFVILSALIITVWFAGTGTARAFWDTVVLGISGILLAVAGWFIQLSIFILKFVIEVSGYNGFIDSTAVIVGWIMVRDVVNMFFVVILLIIAFGTILGLEKYEWKKLLVKLLMAAVIVNFSRIICGVIIDIAQVVMITFINGIAATAGGNLVNMFQVDKILSLSRGSTGAGAINGNTSQIFLASVAAITFAGMMMMTMLTFLFLLMARMVMLWILIVLSPFAFVLNVVPQTEKYASEWWGEFAGNVVAGPIIAFFLWLSFVTVGAGNVMDEISSNNAIPAGTGISSPNAETEQSRTTGISDVMTWANMANFAIAIGMLLAGAKMAQKLGAAGGAMMAKSWEFGKKVGMIASGVAAGRWAARGIGAGAKKAGKFALMKAPLFGGEVWQRQGRALKAAASKTWTEAFEKPRYVKAGKRMETIYGKKKVDLKTESDDVRKMAEERDAAIVAKDENKIIELTKQLEEMGYEVETGTKGKTELGREKHALQDRILARMGLWVAPASFKEEYTKDQEAGAKYAKEHLEHIASTSKTPMGKFKTRAEAELIKLKATGQDIKARKIQDVLRELGATDEKILNAKAGGKSWEAIQKEGKYTEMDMFHAKRTENAIESGAKAKQIEGMLMAQKQVRTLEAIKALLATEAGKKLGAQSMAAQAQLEQLTFDMNQAKELVLASARDKVLIDQGRHSEANNRQIALADQAEKRIKAHSAGLDYVQTLAKAEAQQQRINERKAQLQQEGKTEEQIKSDALLNRMEKSFSEMQLANLAVHAAMADGSKAKILQAAGMDQDQSMDLTEKAIRNLQAQDVAELINERVEATKEGLERGLKRLEQIYGEVMAGAMLERKRLYNEKAAGQGSLNRAGLYKIVGDQTVPVDADSQEDRKFVASRRTAGMSGAKITSIIGFSSSMDRNQTGESMASSEAAKDILTKLISGITANQLTNIDEYVKADLAAVLNNTSLPHLKDVVGRLKKEVKDAKGLAGLLKYALEKGRMSNAENIKEVEEVVSELTRKASEKESKKSKK